MDSLVHSPPRNGPTLWEIGIPDRTAAEFYVPDPYPTLMNKLYNEQRRDKLVQNPLSTIAAAVSLHILFFPHFFPPLFIQSISTFDRFRQYGLWERYADLYPNDDLVYTVGVNKYNKDWFFAHVTR